MDKVLEVIKQTVKETRWEDCNLLIKDMFTTYIFVEGIDTQKAKLIVKEMYIIGFNKSNINIDYKEFESFVFQDIEKQL